MNISIEIIINRYSLKWAVIKRISTVSVSEQKMTTRAISRENSSSFSENYSSKEIREAQDTIYYHLSNFTEHNISEKDIVQEFRVYF